MFIEKRKAKKDTKYYLVHSYREKGKVNKIRKYLGRNLNKEELKREKEKAKQEILKLVEEIDTTIFDFTLTNKQIKTLNKRAKTEIFHLDKKDWERFTEEFVFNTNAIEGSTVQKDEVHDILIKKKGLDDEEIETKGVAKAIEFIRKTNDDLSLSLIKKLHKLCFSGSKDFAGQFRKVEVVIRNLRGEVIHKGVPVKELNNYLKEFVDWYKGNKKKFKPLALAAIIHNQFEHIHPFQDGNGRVGRLLLNFILLKNGYPPLNIALEDRREYYSVLNEYSNNHDLRLTVEFLVKQYKKTLKVTTKGEKG